MKKKALIVLVTLIVTFSSVLSAFIAVSADTEEQAKIDAALLNIAEAARADLIFALADYCLVWSQSSPHTKEKPASAESILPGKYGLGQVKDAYDSLAEVLWGEQAGDGGSQGLSPPAMHDDDKLNCATYQYGGFIGFGESTAHDGINLANALYTLLSSRGIVDSWADIVCNVNDNSKPGLYTRISYDTSNGGANKRKIENVHCDVYNYEVPASMGEGRQLSNSFYLCYDENKCGNGKNYFSHDPPAGFMYARDYIKHLYTLYQAKNEYALLPVSGNSTPLYQIFENNSGGSKEANAVYYSYLLAEFEAACGPVSNLPSSEEKEVSIQYYSTPLKLIDKESSTSAGKTYERYVARDGYSRVYKAQKEGDRYAQVMRGGGGSNKIQCTDLITKINSYADDYVLVLNTTLLNLWIGTCKDAHNAERTAYRTASDKATSFSNRLTHYNKTAEIVTMENVTDNKDDLEARFSFMAESVDGSDQNISAFLDLIRVPHEYFTKSSSFTSADIDSMKEASEELKIRAEEYAASLKSSYDDINTRDTTNPGPKREPGSAGANHLFNYSNVATLDDFECFAGGFEFPVIDLPEVKVPEGDSSAGSQCNIGQLGWIGCPVGSALGGLMDLFTSLVNDQLTIKNSFISGDSDQQNTQQAWSNFRNVANVLLAIFFLFIVISQISGVGITNYGIKKLLPKVIIVALLINLSYIICAIAVDLSNIIGSQLGAFITSIGAEKVQISWFKMIEQAFAGGTAIAVAGAVTAVAAVGAIASGGWVVVLLAVLSAVLATLFFFVILAARQIGVVILIVLSPLAFACFLLPGTESIFKKWWKIFYTLLLIFPVCGLVQGAGKIGYTIIVSATDDFWLLIVAQLITVLPALLIPSMVMGLTKVLGTAGAKINGMMSGARKAARGAVEESDWAKAHRRQSARDNAAMRTGTYKGNNFLRKQFSKRRNEQIKNNPDSTLNRYRQQAGASLEAAEKKRELEDEMTIVLNDTNKGDVNMLKKEYDKAVKAGDTKKIKAIFEIAGDQKFKAKEASEWFDKDSREGNLSAEISETIARQMSTGGGARNYRAANALTFQYASDVNGSSASAQGSFGDWSTASTGGTSNLARAYENHITNPSELYGQSKKVIKTLGDAKIIDSEFAAAAQEAAASNPDVYDRTKDEALEAISKEYKTAQRNIQENADQEWSKRVDEQEARDKKMVEHLEDISKKLGNPGNS